MSVGRHGELGRHEHYAKLYVDVLECDDLWEMAKQYGHQTWSVWIYLIIKHKERADGNGWIKRFSIRRMGRHLGSPVDDELINEFLKRNMVEVRGETDGYFDIRVPRALELQTMTNAQKAARHRKRKADETADDPETYVYFIGAHARGSNECRAVKIGKSKNPWSRVKELQTGSSDELILLHHVRAPTSFEAALHDYCSDISIGGEWFAYEEPAKTMILARQSYETLTPIVVNRSNATQLPLINQTKPDHTKERQSLTHTPAHASRTDDAYFVDRAINEYRNNTDNPWSDSVYESAKALMLAAVDSQDVPKSVKYWTTPSPTSGLSRVQEHVNAVVEGNAQAATEQARELAERSKGQPPWLDGLIHGDDWN